MNELFKPYQHIKYQVENRIATITLNRPEKLNAFTATMREELIRAFSRADEDDEIRVIIVTGASGRSALGPICRRAVTLFTLKTRSAMAVGRCR